MSTVPSEVHPNKQPTEVDAATRAAARPTGWILTSAILGAATLMLLIWVASLEAQSNSAQNASNAQQQSVATSVAELATRQQAEATNVAGLAAQQQAAAASGADRAAQAQAVATDAAERVAQTQATATVVVASITQQLTQARADFETVKRGLTSTNEDLATTQARVPELDQRAIDANARAQTTAGDINAALVAAQARADARQACINDMIGLMNSIFIADDPAAALPSAAAQLKQMEPHCVVQ